MQANVDLDIAVYMIGSVTENKHWLYKGQRWDSKVLLNKELKRDGLDDSAITCLKEPEPIEKVKETIVKFYENLDSYLECDTQGYLSGKGNFRYETATIQPYKGNRTGLEKPTHYDTIRQFFIDVYDAKLSIGMEADDAIGLAHDPEEDIIVSTDKDLDCIPGLHYNWDRQSCYWVTELEANRHFFKQVLIGDSTDNIMGLFGVGKDSQLVKNLYQIQNVGDMKDYVISEYKKRFGSYWEIFFNETARLVWILQKRERPV